MTEFQLPKNIRYTENCGLDLEFQEMKIRGSQEIICQVLVTENPVLDNEHYVIDSYCFKSWEEMKEQFPTMMDFLKELANNPKWQSKWRDYDRIYFISSSNGHEGLYDIQKTVWFDAQNEESSDNPPLEKLKKVNKIK
jgi:hypothetical protein